MADDKTVVHIGENSPEQVAYRLMEVVARVEKRSLFPSDRESVVDRDYLLTLYSECLHAVTTPKRRQS